MSHMRVASSVIAAFICFLGESARAHDFTPGVLSLVERAPGLYEHAWTPPVDSGVEVSVRVVFPSHCRAHDGRALDCGARGLDGAIAFRGLSDHRARVVVLVERIGRGREEHVVGGESPRLVIGRDAPDRSAIDELASWIVIGVEHIALGFDHIAFLVGLLLLAGIDRRTIATVTAFTVAHSNTLALAALDVVRLESAPVEALIAASVVLVAREGMHDRVTLARRAPWIVALAFGLVHGLGFAGALREIGLPREGIALPLLGFNVGVELGQLALVGLALGLSRVVTRPPRWARPAAGYVIGCAGAAWMIARVVVMITAPS